MQGDAVRGCIYCVACVIVTSDLHRKQRRERETRCEREARCMLETKALTGMTDSRDATVIESGNLDCDEE